MKIKVNEYYQVVNSDKEDGLILKLNNNGILTDAYHFMPTLEELKLIKKGIKKMENFYKKNDQKLIELAKDQFYKNIQG